MGDRIGNTGRPLNRTMIGAQQPPPLTLGTTGTTGTDSDQAMADAAPGGGDTHDDQDTVMAGDDHEDVADSSVVEISALSPPAPAVPVEDNATFLRGPHRRPATSEDYWQGVKLLGRGGFGRSGLWVRYNRRTHRILERMVVKEIQPRRDKFDDEGEWWIEGHLQKYDAPREAMVAMMLAHDSIARTLAYSVDEVNRRYRIYMEMVGYQTLQHLLDIHIGGQQSLDDGSVVTVPGQPFPEPFCWFALRRMAAAADIMQRFPQINQSEDYPQWLHVAQVVHQDIKPSNIFLAPAVASSYPVYPRAKLGDFGSARVTFPGDGSNSRGWRDGTTLGYLAPEMDRIFKAHGFPMGGPGRHSYATNIWQIGQTVRHMMMLLDHPSQHQIIYATTPIINWGQPMTNMAAAYSTDLIDTIRACLNPTSALRITPANLIAACDNLGANHMSDMDDRRLAKDSNHRQYHLRPHELKDDYEVGMRLNEAVLFT